MRASDKIREIFFPVAVVVMVGTIWAMGYEHALTSQVKRSWWPPANQQLADRVLQANGAGAGALPLQMPADGAPRDQVSSVSSDGD